MVKAGTATKVLYDDVFQFNKLSQEKSTSLKSIKSGDNLNSIENILLANFDDVVISLAAPNCYFVNKESYWGMYNLNGDIIVPPIPGYPRIITGTGRIYMGDSAPISDWKTYIFNARGRARRAFSGSFAVVLDKETLEPVIPLGTYDEIHFTMKGTNTYYYISVMDENGDLKWGVCNKGGEVVVPCEYNFVGLSKGEFVGDNSKNMEEVMASLKKILQRRQYNSEHKIEIFGHAISNVANSIANAVAAFGDAIISLDEAMQESGAYEALNSLSQYYGGSAGAYSPSYDISATSYNSTQTNFSNVSSNMQSPKFSLSEQNTYNKDKSTYKDCDGRVAKWRYGGVSHTESDVKETGRQMRNLRQKWEAKGKSFPHFDNEDWCFR